MSLPNLQAELAEAILAQDHTMHIMPARNIQIYRQSIESHLIQALKDTYPLITKLLGDDFFQITAKEYIKRYPSRSGNLHDFGEYFSDFIAEYPPVRNLIYLAEVAQFEWICHSIYFAADACLFDIHKLEHFSAESFGQLHFVLHPAAQLMKSHYPLLRIIDLCKGEIDDTLNLNEGGVNLLIIRRHLELALVSLSASEFAFLSALQDNQPLREALKMATHLDTDFQIHEKLSAWIKDKIIVDCYSTNE